MAEIGELKVGDDVTHIHEGRHSAIVKIGKVRMMLEGGTHCTVAWDFHGRFPTVKTHPISDLRKLEY